MPPMRGIDWVLLTNGIVWRVDRVSFTKPISNEQVIGFDLLSLNHRNSTDIQNPFSSESGGNQKISLAELS